MKASSLLMRALVWGPLTRGGGRTTLAGLGIALGVALATAVHSIHDAAVTELDRAVRNLSGNADYMVRGPRDGFDESLYPTVAQLPGVDFASPSLEIEAKIPGRDATLKVLGIDPFRASEVQEKLTHGLRGHFLDFLADDAVVLSAKAARQLELKAGDTLTLQAGLTRRPLRVIALMTEEDHPASLALMDIATAQQAFDHRGRITRLDLRLAPGADLPAFRQQIRALLPAGVQLDTPEETSGVFTGFSRPYRANLTALGGMAIFTGIFLVFSTQALSLLRRRKTIALARTLGATRAQLLGLLMLESALLGLVASALGIALGQLLSRATLNWIGSDLGAGYFSGLSPAPEWNWPDLLALWLIGITATLAGALWPAWQTVQAPPAQQIKSTGGNAAGARRGFPTTGRGA